MMELNRRQKALCLKNALGALLTGWKGTLGEAWQRLQDLNEKSPDECYFDEDIDVVVCDLYEHHCVSDVVEKIDNAIYANGELVKAAFRFRTRNRKPRARKKRAIEIVVQGGMVQEVKNLPSGCTYRVNDRD